MTISRRYLTRRAVQTLFQLVGVSIVTFALVRLLPGDPAIRILGPLATPDGIQHLRSYLGLDQPLPVQYALYLANTLHGDLGTSTFTGNPVAVDLLQRFPATLELMLSAVVAIVLVGIPLGVLSSNATKNKYLRTVVGIYGRVAGGVPDFWLATMLVLFVAGRVPGLPSAFGRLGVGDVVPAHITGLYTVDSLLTLDFPSFIASLTHLILPAFTLAFVYGSILVRITQRTVDSTLTAHHVLVARAKGVPLPQLIGRHVLRANLLPILTTVASTFGYLLGGAVLVERVFSWGGLGEYAVQAVVNSDYTAIQGFVLVAAAFSILVFFLLEIAYSLADPRVRTQAR